jgi:hypothetical protein
MRKIILLCASLCAMVLSFSASPVMAQQWVSPNGSDANACTPTAPCATFQRAINVGASQINCLGSGSYGPITITTSLVIDCGTGNVGEITSNPGGRAVNIDTSSAANIVLSHLSLNGGGVNGTNGIYTQNFASGTLIVEDCSIQGSGSVNYGIYFAPSSGRGLLQVSNSILYNNGTAIAVNPSAGQIASVTLNTVELVANTNFGLYLYGSGVVAGTIRNSVVGENGFSGVVAQASQVFFTVEESSIIDNLANGIQTLSAGSAIKVAASTIGGNGTGVLASSGSIISFGDNHISDNGSDGNFTSTKALK